MNVLMPNFAKRGGIIPVITQCAMTQLVLMQAYINREAYEKTLKTGLACYWSTSRNRLWVKGEESGNTQEIMDIQVDCDGDCLLFFVRQSGPVCHTKNRSCFSRSVFSENDDLPNDFKKTEKERIAVESVPAHPRFCI